MRNWRKTLATVLTASSLTCVCFGQNVASPADAFVDSIGVNIHLTYTNTPYGSFEGLVKPELLKSGIRHVRDGVVTWPGADADTYFYEELRELSGLKVTLITDPSNDLADYPNLQSWCGGKLEALEGINEPEMQGNPDWAAQTATWQQTLYGTVQSTASLAGVKVLAPSVAWYDVSSVANLTNYCDFTNAHDYTSGDVPMTNYGWVSGGAENMASQPLWITETGYHNATQGSDNSQVGVSELASSKYVLRTFFDYFNAGAFRTFDYELLDESGADEDTNQEDSFGLIRADGTEKPAFTGISNLIGMLKDPGAAFTPAGLAYTLSGGDSNTTTTLLQKRNGSFWLGYWEEVSVWDRVAMEDLANPPVPVTVSFPSPMNVAFYDPLQSVHSSGTLRGVSSVTLNCGDSVQLLKITPVATP